MSSPCLQYGERGSCRNRKDNKLCGKGLLGRALQQLRMPAIRCPPHLRGAFCCCLVRFSASPNRARLRTLRDKLICNRLCLSSLGIYFKRPSRLFRPSRGMCVRPNQLSVVYGLITTRSRYSCDSPSTCNVITSDLITSLY